MQKIKAWLLGLGSNPVFQFFLGVAEKSAVGYLTACSFQLNKAWMYGLASAVAGGLYHGFQVWLQQQTLNTPNTSGDSPKLTLKKMAGMFLLLGFIFVLVSPASAQWLVKSGSIAKDVAPQTNIKSVSLNGKVSALPPGLHETDLILMPTVGLGYGVSKGDVPSYGFDVAYDFFLAGVNGVDTTASNVTPYFGLGGAAFVDAGGWLHSNMVDPVKCRLGVNAVGPQIGLFVPSVNLVWDLNNKSREALVMVRAPFGALENILAHKVCKVGK